MVDTGDLKSPGLTAVRVQVPFRVSFESEFDTIKFWLFLLSVQKSYFTSFVRNGTDRAKNKRFFRYWCYET